MATQVITGLLGQTADTAKMRKLTGDSGLGESDMKASVAALEYIISSAARLVASPPFLVEWRHRVSRALERAIANPFLNPSPSTLHPSP